MAKWKLGDKTRPEGLKGTFEYESGKAEGEYAWTVTQDEKPFIEQAKLEREATSKKDIGYKKFATIPDIVAIEIMTKYGIDIHDADTFSDKTMMRKFMYIVKTEYPYLMSY